MLKFQYYIEKLRFHCPSVLGMAVVSPFSLQKSEEKKYNGKERLKVRIDLDIKSIQKANIQMTKTFPVQFLCNH